MKYLLLCFCGLIIIRVSGQSFNTYLDAENRFTIGIPPGWHASANGKYPSLVMAAYRAPERAEDVSHENVNLQILDAPGENLAISVENLLHGLEDAKDFKLQQQGYMTVSGKQCKWIIETHTNAVASSVAMEDYVFVIYSAGKSYVLTFAAFASSFGRYKHLFEQVASSLTISDPGEERLSLRWSAEEQWNVIGFKRDSLVETTQFLPRGSTADHWETLGVEMKFKNLRLAHIHLFVKNISDNALRESPLARLTILEEHDTGPFQWALFTIETASFPNDPQPQSEVYWVIQGQHAIYSNFIATKEKTLSPDFIHHWSGIFKNGRLVHL